ncbi:MAG: type 4a pilus biogenesis protein PilO [Candidatus Riflebacteria bacterium]|nr:type 4a pilus biogenesis protein PilO [Candidatus Riflebacteria bacterium]
MNNHFMLAIFICILMVIGTGIGFYSTVWEKVTEEETQLKADLEKLQQEAEKLKGIDKEIEKYNKQIEEQEALRKKLQTDSIPLNEVVPKLLDSTEIIANKFNVKFQDIRISPLVRAEDWNELPVEMTILGTFKNVTCFLNVMEKRKIINLAAGSMNVSVSSEVDKETKSPMLSVNLSAKVYLLQ